MFYYKLLNSLKNSVYDWLGINDIDKDIDKLNEDIDDLRKILKERTEYHLDVHQYKGSQVILIGKYRKADFVKCYSINDDSLRSLIQHCKELEKYARRDKIDAWPSFSTVINDELSRIGY